MRKSMPFCSLAFLLLPAFTAVLSAQNGSWQQPEASGDLVRKAKAVGKQIAENQAHITGTSQLASSDANASPVVLVEGYATNFRKHWGFWYMSDNKLTLPKIEAMALDDAKQKCAKLSSNAKLIAQGKEFELIDREPDTNVYLFRMCQTAPDTSGFSYTVEHVDTPSLFAGFDDTLKMLQELQTRCQARGREAHLIDLPLRGQGSELYYLIQLCRFKEAN